MILCAFVTPKTKKKVKNGNGFENIPSRSRNCLLFFSKSFQGKGSEEVAEWFLLPDCVPQENTLDIS